jgi:hypothetical protein
MTKMPIPFFFVKRAVLFILRKIRWFGYYRFVKSYLIPKNYGESVPRDEKGVSPWFTYPAIKFLSTILDGTYRIFEYGSGSSTSYFLNSCKEVVSIEHDKFWFDKVQQNHHKLTLILSEFTKNSESENSSIFLEFLNLPEFSVEFPSDETYTRHGLVTRGYTDYALKLLDFPQGHFDIVVIDGMARNFCGYLAAKHISDRGFLILDNSDRWQYNSLLKYLNHLGFARIDFWGPGPINAIEWCTSFFFKNVEVFKNLKLRELDSGDLSHLDIEPILPHQS